MTEMQVIMELMNALGDLKTEEELDINELNIVFGRQDDGVLLKISSPDKDGVKLAEGIGKLMTKLPKLIQMQSPDLVVNYSERDLTTKKSED